MTTWLSYFRFRSLLGALPILVFLTVRSVWDAEPAIIAGFSTSVLAYIVNRGQTGPILALSTLALAIGAAATVGALWQGNEWIYFAGDPAWDFVMAVLALGSLVIGRPLGGLVICELVPSLRSHMHELRVTFIAVTLLAGLVFLFLGVVRTTLLLTEDSIERYLVISRAVQWPTSLVAILVMAWLVRRVLQQLERGELEDEPASHPVRHTNGPSDGAGG